MLCFVSYGFVDKLMYSQPISQQTPEEVIIGVWLRENQPTDKMEFFSNGEVKRYFNNELQYTETYSISNQCGVFTSNDEILYLHTIDLEDGTENCNLIMNGVYDENSNTLTLIDDNGRINIYIRQ